MSSKATTRGKGTAPDLASALAAALAATVDLQPEDIEVTLDLPSDVTFPPRLDLEVVVEAEAAAAAGDVESEPAGPARRPRGGGRARGSQPAADAVAVPEASSSAAAADDERSEPESPALTPEELDQEADAAADFLEGLLDALDLPGDLRIKVHADHAEIEIVDIGNGALIGRRGQTLEAIQELVRCTLQRQFQRRSHIKVDAEGYRARRMEKLVEKTEEAIDEVLETGQAVRLEPMDVFERKTVHQMVAEVDGLTSRSQGREPARRVVILQE